MGSTRCGWKWPIQCLFAIGLALNALFVFAQEPMEFNAPRLKYVSIFNHYKNFNEQPVTDWRENNDTVEKIGGWRAYAKEARQPDVNDKAASTTDDTEMNRVQRAKHE